MTDAEYKEYCRCWNVHQDRIFPLHKPTVSDKAFRARLLERLLAVNAGITGVRKWPGNWVEVGVWFKGVDNFVAAVQYAERP